MDPEKPFAVQAWDSLTSGQRALGPVLAVGLARDCGQTVRAEVDRISAALMGFRRLQWLVIESDSTDDTVPQLESLRDNRKDFDFESLGVLQTTKPLRTDRIAYCRNRYLDRLASDATYREVEFLVVVDLDGVNDLLSPGAILSCWDFGGWDVVTANQLAPYYDLWALRHSEWMQGDCWRQYEFLLANGLSRGKALHAAVVSRFIRIAEVSPPIEVDSAFGGMAIYRRHAIGDSRYVGLSPDGYEVCEHVTFHASLRAKGCRIFINPRMVNTGWNEHTRTLRFWPRLRVTHWLPVKAWLGRVTGRRRSRSAAIKKLDA